LDASASNARRRGLRDDELMLAEVKRLRDALDHALTELEVWRYGGI